MIFKTMDREGLIELIDAAVIVHRARGQGARRGDGRPEREETG
jgi:hypothetical protein